MTLVQWLSTINSCESQWGLWVNSENIEEYRIGQVYFENGGVLEGWAYISNLDRLTHERRSYCGEEDGLYEHIWGSDGLTQYKNKLVKYNPRALADAYSSGLCDEDFIEHFRTEAEKSWQELSEEWAEAKVEDLKKYFASGGEWERLQEEQKLLDVAELTK